MSNRLLSLLGIFLMCLTLPVIAQEEPTPTPTLIPIEPLARGAAPRADFITATAADTPFTVIVQGTEGAVYPSALVAVRNVYTGATSYGVANFNGSFALTVAGLPEMPYQVNVADNFAELNPPPNLEGIGVIVHPRYQPTALEGTRFATGGNYAYGAGTWLANGNLNTLTPDRDDEVRLTLNVTMFGADLIRDLPYRFRGQLALRRLFDENGVQLSTAQNTGNDWSSDVTPTNLPILGRTVPDVLLSETITDEIVVDRDAGTLQFSFFFSGRLPPDLPAGIYMPVLTGQVSVNNSQFENWADTRTLSTRGTDDNPATDTILPLVMPIGDRFAAPQVEFVFFDSLPYQLPNGRHFLPPTTETRTFRPRLVGLPQVLPFESVLLEATRDERQLVIIGDSLYIDTADTYRILPEDTQALFEAGGIMADVYQNPYLFAHSVQPTIASPLVLHHSTFTGTPLLPTQSVPLVGMVTPPQAATIQLDINSAALTTVTQLQTNRFGYYYAPPLDLAAGDYRFDWQMQSFFNPYAGLVTQAGVVVNAPDPTNGVQGLANYDRAAQAWFDTASFPSDAPLVRSILNFPYYNGDVVFLPDADTAALRPVLATGAYQYLSAVRPGVVVQDAVLHNSMTEIATINNDDTLANQVGAGSQGNLSEDVMWLFGGGVEADGTIRGYSAVAVMTNQESARVVPPLTEPLLTDFDIESATQQPVTMFVQPTGVQAGQVLEIGDTLALSGYLAPTVPADILTTMLTPTRRLTQTTTANSFGFFYAPQNDMTVTETGRYRVYLDATYAGATSAGMLSEPVRGGLLGGAQGMWIFVVDPAQPMLTTPRDNTSIVGIGGAVTINVRAPETWTDTVAYAVARTPQWILEQVELDTFANQTNYTFNRPQIAARYPNLETNARAASDSDEIIITLAITGTDETGTRQTQARIFTLRGETLITFGD